MAWNRSASFRLTQWLKIIPHMIRTYMYYRCCCINEPVIFSHRVHLKLGHRFHALLKVPSDRDGTGHLNISFQSVSKWFDKSQISWKSGPGSPFGQEDKAPWTSCMFNFRGFTDSPHPHQQETTALDTIQLTSFFPLVATFLLSRQFWGKGRFVKKSWN